MVSVALVLYYVGAIIGNAYGIQVKNYVALPLGSEMSRRFRRTDISGVVVSKSEFQSSA